ncbi:MAG: gephyrin-like molybdotransferase Glp, partial [Pyrinomonadaceae bacterium]
FFAFSAFSSVANKKEGVIINKIGRNRFMIPISRAIKIIESQALAIGFEHVDIGDAAGRVLAENIVADTDLPPFDRSQMDGFAVIARDTRDAPVALKIVGESAAGSGWHHKMKSGEAVRIMTGAPVPKGADAVQKTELTSEERVDERVLIREPAERRKFIVPKGFEVKKGETVFSKGEVVSDMMIASLAAFGYARVKVGQSPRVAILATGSEIVPVDKRPGRDQIRNSNSVALKVLVERAGAVAKTFPIAKDDISALTKQIGRAASSSDIVIVTGGVSVGKYDLTKAALRELGAEIVFERVRLRPGKPTVFAKLGDTLFFGLPGNPVSAAVTFLLFVRTAIMKMQGAIECELVGGQAILPAAAKGAKERDTYLPATLKTDKAGSLLAKPLRWHGSSDLIGFARAQALIFVPRGKTLEARTVVNILYL